MRNHTLALLLPLALGVSPLHGQEKGPPAEAPLAKGGARTVTVVGLGAIEDTIELPARIYSTVLTAVTRLVKQPATDTSHIVVLRSPPGAGDVLPIVVDFREMVLTGNTTRNVLLTDGDILFTVTATDLPEAESPRALEMMLVDRAMRAAEDADHVGQRLGVRACAHRMRRATDAIERSEACRKLASYEQASDDAVSELLTVLREHPELAREAIPTLGMMGGRAKRAIPVLIGLTQGPDRELRALATAALKQIQREPG